MQGVLIQQAELRLEVQMPAVNENNSPKNKNNMKFTLMSLYLSNHELTFFFFIQLIDVVILQSLLVKHALHTNLFIHNIDMKEKFK